MKYQVVTLSVVVCEDNEQEMKAFLHDAELASVGVLNLGITTRDVTKEELEMIESELGKL